MDETIKKFKKEIGTILEFFKNCLASIRSNRPHPGLVENIKVDYYNTQTPLKQMANIQVSQPSLIVQPWDKSALGPCEKAIQAANLGVSVVNEGMQLRIIFPPLSQERRLEMIGLVCEKAEECRKNLRHLRDESIKEINGLFESKKIGEDDKFRKKDEIQKIADETNQLIEGSIKKKEEELRA